jgi:hypothetical protein
MSAKRWALSFFFIWHVTAIALGSLQSPGAVVPVGLPRHPDNNVIAAGVTPALDRIASGLAPIPAAINRAAGPVRTFAAAYLEVTGVAQSWKMFSNPPQVFQYLRVRYYIGRRGDGRRSALPVWTATELVLPAHREDEIRMVRGYWDGFRDKAMTSALQRFQNGRSDRLIKPDTKSSELPDDIAPIARYFARRFQHDALTPDERILRTEIWYGISSIPPPGESLDPNRLAARRSLLRKYYEGPIENHFGTPVYPAYRSTEDEADIRWFLEYFEPDTP